MLFENEKCVVLAVDPIAARFSWGLDALSTGQAGSLNFLGICNFRSGHQQQF